MFFSTTDIDDFLCSQEFHMARRLSIWKKRNIRKSVSSVFEMKYAQFLLASILGPPWFLILLFSLLPEPPLGCLTDISFLTYLKPNSPHSPTLPTFLPTSPYSFPHFINAALPFHFFLSLIQSTSKNEEKQLALPSEYIQNPSLFPLPPKWSSSFPVARF